MPPCTGCFFHWYPPNKISLDINKAILKNIYIDIDINKAILKNINIDIDKKSWRSIDIDKGIIKI